MHIILEMHGYDRSVLLRIFTWFLFLLVPTRHCPVAVRSWIAWRGSGPAVQRRSAASNLLRWRLSVRELCRPRRKPRPDTSRRGGSMTSLTLPRSVATGFLHEGEGGGGFPPLEIFTPLPGNLLCSVSSLWDWSLDWGSWRPATRSWRTTSTARRQPLENSRPNSSPQRRLATCIYNVYIIATFKCTWIYRQILESREQGNTSVHCIYSRQCEWLELAWTGLKPLTIRFLEGCPMLPY